LDAANLSVAEAAAAQSTAEIETKRARERVVEAEWERFTLETVQTACWNGLEKKRTRCKEEVNTALLSAKVDWLICRLEKNAKPFLQKAPFDRPPTSSSRLLLSDGNASSLLVLCDRDLRDGGGTPGTP
jgi:hypothetical protein